MLDPQYECFIQPTLAHFQLDFYPTEYIKSRVCTYLQCMDLRFPESSGIPEI